MKDNFMTLYKDFDKIRNMGWIQSKRNGSTGIGYTFESLLNIQENSFAVPDYMGIELKTMRILSKKRIHLFNAEPDGDFLFPTNRILDKLGYPCKAMKEYKVFMSATHGKTYSYIGYSKKTKLIVDKNSRKVNMIAKDRYDNNIDIDISWSFDLLEKKIYTKEKFLAIIKAMKKEENGVEYFHFVHIDFYEIKGFETFLELIENGTITVTFKINVYKEGEKLGRIDNHGTDFSIKEEDIEMLYNKIDVFSKSAN